MNVVETIGKWKSRAYRNSASETALNALADNPIEQLSEVELMLVSGAGGHDDKSVSTSHEPDGLGGGDI